MKRAVLLASGLATLCGVLAAAPGCSSMSSARCWFLKGACLTYEQYLAVDQTANPAPTADYVIKTLGAPLEVHDRDGVPRRVDYHCYSLNGDMKIAEFQFDENQKLVKKELW
jgi:hypothetical protein